MFSLDILGAPVFCRPHSVRCVFCDRDALRSQLRDENSKQDVWSSLARLFVLDREVYEEAFARVPTEMREETDAAVRPLVCALVNGVQFQARRVHELREVLRIRAMHALLENAEAAPVMTRQVRLDTCLLAPLRVLGRRLPSFVLEQISLCLCTESSIKTICSALLHVKQHGYNPMGHPIFTAEVPLMGMGEMSERLADNYNLAWRIHQKALGRLRDALAKHRALLENIPLQACVPVAAKAWALVASMTSEVHSPRIDAE